MKIQSKVFGQTKNNEEVILYTIETSKIKIEILNYGCVIKSLYTPNRDGKMENIVLGFDNLSDYEKDNTPYFGAIVGRIAGRTKNGILEINGEIYQLTQNDGTNNLHGGLKGLHNRVWESSYESVDDKVVLSFKTICPHLEDGYPGTVDILVKYIVNEDSITIEYQGKPDRPTYMNLTNHVYFNLSGNFKENIYEQELKFNALGYYSVDRNTLPVKLITEDEIFNKDKGIFLGKARETNSEQLKIVGNGYDHPFLLSKEKDIDGYVVDEKSGRRIEFITDQPIVVFYTGNYLEGVSNYPKHYGFCLETQDYPDIANLCPENMKIYSTENIYTQKTTYLFK